MKAEDSFDINLKNILNLLKNYYEVDFSSYKISCLKRRIKRRILLTRRKNITDYMEYLTENPDERKILFNTITINVTRFFRDEATYKFVFEKILPALRSKKNIKIWSAGCSSGEEAYSLAMMLEYYKETNNLNYIYQIYGSDIDKSSIEKARNGVYTPKSILNLTGIFKTMFNYYIKKEGNYYHINSKLKKNVLFEQESIFSSRWNFKFDIIFCRNVFIYFTRELQDKALTIFAERLKEDGYLVLGRVETIFSSIRDRFNIISNKDKIYSLKK